MGRPRFRINLLDEEREELQSLVNARSSPQGLVRRARIILLANGACWSNQAIAEELGIRKCDVTRWTKRWIECAPESVRARLSDRPRAGRPPRIGTEQWCSILALACEPPQQHGRPITHWSSRELAEEACAQGIVERLSPGHLRKVLKKKISSPIAAATG